MKLLRLSVLLICVILLADWTTVAAVRSGGNSASKQSKERKTPTKDELKK